MTKRLSRLLEGAFEEDEEVLDPKTLAEIPRCWGGSRAGGAGDWVLLRFCLLPTSYCEGMGFKATSSSL